MVAYYFNVKCYREIALHIHGQKRMMVNLCLVMDVLVSLVAKNIY